MAAVRRIKNKAKVEAPPPEPVVPEVRSRRGATGMTVGKPPKAGEDKRPWEVFNKANPDVFTIRCWYEDTADNYLKVVGKQYDKRRRFPATMPVRKKSAAAKKIVRR